MNTNRPNRPVVDGLGIALNLAAVLLNVTAPVRNLALNILLPANFLCLVFFSWVMLFNPFAHEPTNDN